MTSPELNWAAATVDNGITMVPWAEMPDWGWLLAFKNVLERWEDDEERDHQWSGIAPSADQRHVVIENLDADAADRAKRYLAGACVRATVEAERQVKKDEEEKREAQQRAADSADLQRRLREG